MKDHELPENFMDHLEFRPEEVPEDAVIPALEPGYPLIFVDG